MRVIIEKFERQQKGVALDGPDEGSKTNKGKREDYKAGKLSNHEEETGTDEFRFFSSLTSDLGTELPLHLSLSRPNVLKTEEKAEFLDLLEGKLRKSSVRGYT